MQLQYAAGVIEDSGHRVLASVDGTSFQCRLTAEQQEALGQQLVTRWNAHGDLVAALRAYQAAERCLQRPEGEGRACNVPAGRGDANVFFSVARRKADAALAKAGAA